MLKLIFQTTIIVLGFLDLTIYLLLEMSFILLFVSVLLLSILSFPLEELPLAFLVIMSNGDEFLSFCLEISFSLHFWRIVFFRYSIFHWQAFFFFFFLSVLWIHHPFSLGLQNFCREICWWPYKCSFVCNELFLSWAFKVLLYLMFNILIMMCLRVICCGVILLRILWASYTWMSISVPRFGKFSTITSYNKLSSFSPWCHYLFTFWCPIIHVGFLNLFSFFLLFVFSSVIVFFIFTISVCFFFMLSFY